MALNVPNKEFGFQTVNLEESHRGGSVLAEKHFKFCYNVTKYMCMYMKVRKYRKKGNPTP